MMKKMPTWNDIKTKIKDKTKSRITKLMDSPIILAAYLCITKNIDPIIKIITYLHFLLCHNAITKTKTKHTERFESTLKNYVGQKGEFAFCLTDIVGSTRLWNIMEKDMQKKVRHHSSIGFRLSMELNGYVSKMEGDSFFVAFKNLKSAIKFGKKLIKENKKCTMEPRFDIRVAVSEGQARVGGGNFNYMFRGEAVQTVYSLNDMAKPNTINTKDGCINIK